VCGFEDRIFVKRLEQSGARKINSIYNLAIHPSNRSLRAWHTYDWRRITGNKVS
jgi:hypothetical protein